MVVRISLEENRSIVCKVVEAENTRNLEVIDELIAPAYFNKSLQLKGPEGYKQLLTVIFRAFPDWHETIEDMVAEGEKVCIHLEIDTGEQTGEFNFMRVKVPPTGNRSKVKSIQIWHITDGKVVEQNSVHDELDLYNKLGLIKPTEKGKKLFPDDSS
jgi:predicted ester cyclase